MLFGLQENYAAIVEEAPAEERYTQYTPKLLNKLTIFGLLTLAAARWWRRRGVLRCVALVQIPGDHACKNHNHQHERDCYIAVMHDW